MKEIEIHIELKLNNLNTIESCKIFFLYLLLLESMISNYVNYLGLSVNYQINMHVLKQSTALFTVKSLLMKMYVY